MSARQECLRELEVAAMRCQNWLGGDLPPEAMTPHQLETVTAFMQEEYARLAGIYSEADLRWAAQAIKDDSRYEEPAPRVLPLPRSEATMGYWQTVGTRIIVSLVTGGIFFAVLAACQASGR